MGYPTLAVDLGATKTVVGQVYGSRVLRFERHDTGALLRHGGDVRALLARLHALRRPNTQGVAVGFAGPVRDGVVTAGVNFPAGVVPARFPLARLLARRLGLPAVVVNDAQCFTVGEATYGAGRGRRRVVGLTLGTGVGGAVVFDGELYEGAHGLAGEFGHLPFLSAGTRCGCGQRGHLETVLSGPGVRRLYLQQSGRDESSVAVVRAARRGDRAARASLAAAGEALAHLLLTVLVAVDPDVVVVGGGFAQVPKLLVNARTQARQLVPYPALRRTAIVPSLLNSQAVLVGAAHLAAATLTRAARTNTAAARPLRAV
jgi:glucokinase